MMKLILGKLFISSYKMTNCISALKLFNREKIVCILFPLPALPELVEVIGQRLLLFFQKFNEMKIFACLLTLTH